MPIQQPLFGAVSRRLCAINSSRRVAQNRLAHRASACSLRETQNRNIREVSNDSQASTKFRLAQAAEAGRPDFERSAPITVTKAPSPQWRYGDGVSSTVNEKSSHVELDPDSRHFISNYKLLISAIPRPISLVSTISADGSKSNLAPFSYFQIVDHDPPIFVIGFSARKDRLKDTRQNLVDTNECVISVVSEHMIEAVNATSLELPHGVSEWELSGFRTAESRTVRPKRVQEAIFSIEGRLLEMKPLNYGKASGEPHGALAIIRGTRFWVREDSINVQRDRIDLDKLRPLVQLGGISYGCISQTFELPRPKLNAELRDERKGLSRFIQSDIYNSRQANFQEGLDSKSGQ